MPRVRLTCANVVATLALVLAMSGGAIAATHYLITSTHQISPRVLRALRGRQGSRGQQGVHGQAGQGPAYAVANTTGYRLTDPTDGNLHAIATLNIPAAGDYVATAKVRTYLAGGSNMGRSICDLTAHTTAGSGSDDTDESTSWVSISDNSGEQTMPLEVAHHFSGSGTIVLYCEQNGLFSGGAIMGWANARIIATQVSSLSNTAVTG
ncbi:MAG TPA: hypothetical protein VIX82_16450 [Solirubrobacteraceae bacterium]